MYASMTVRATGLLRVMILPFCSLLPLHSRLRTSASVGGVAPVVFRLHCRLERQRSADCDDGVGRIGVVTRMEIWSAHARMSGCRR